MTEPDWLHCTTPRPMLEFLRRPGDPSPRKLRLFAVACCRRVEHLLAPDAVAALDVAERFADGRGSIDERKAALARALASDWVGPPRHPLQLVSHARGSAKSCVCYALAGSRYDASSGAATNSEVAAGQYEVNRVFFPGRHELGAAWVAQCDGLFAAQCRAQADLLRDIFGNPFRPQPTLDPAALSPDAVRLARAIYDDRPFDGVPALAAALEAAGCRDARLLDHCRQPGGHVRGCWVVDVVLGRS